MRRPDTLRRWMAAYAAATATATSLEKIRDAATHNEATPAKTTVLAYRDALLRLFILDPVDGWVPPRTTTSSGSRRARSTTSPTRRSRPRCSASQEKLLRGESGLRSLPRDGTFLGALFESLVTLSVRVFAQAAEAQVRHLRTSNGDREVDLIVQGRAGEVVAVEVKLSATVDDHDVRHLRWLREQIKDDLRAAVVITTGPQAYRRADGIFVVPLALLGP